MKRSTIAYLIWVGSIMLLQPTASIAVNKTQTNMIASTQAIEGLDQTLKEIKSKINTAVVFPAQVPKNAENKKYYVTADFSGEQQGVSYRIYIDATKDCHGVKVCNMGMIQAEHFGLPTIKYDRENREITVPVQLAHHHKGYFTPGYAMGDYVPPSIQWRDKEVLYTLSWRGSIGSEKKILRNMANATISDR